MANTAKVNYAEKLRDPRWQKKRLEIMQRDEFTCRECMAKDKTLNVHHCYYKWGNDPWQYPDASLVTLCENCHKDQDTAKDAKAELSHLLSSIGFRSGHFWALVQFINTIYQNVDMPPERLLHILLADSPHPLEKNLPSFLIIKDKRKKKSKEDKKNG